MLSLMSLARFRTSLQYSRCFSISLINTNSTNFPSDSKTTSQIKQLPPPENNQGRTFYTCGGNVFGNRKYDFLPPTVYTGNITNVVKAVKFFSYSTSFIGLAMQPFVFDRLLSHGLGLTIFAEVIVFFYSILTPVILHLICKRYVVSMHFESVSKEFTAVTLSLFFRQKRLKFKAADVKVPDNVGPFTSIYVTGKPLLLNPKLFEDVNVYAHMMGYDKPLDFKLKNEDSDSTKTKV